MSRIGVLPKQMLRQIMELGYVKGIAEQYLNPASIDLPLSDEAWRLGNVFMPRPDAKIRDLLKIAGATPHDLKHPLEVGVPYLIKVAGEWELPKTVYGYVNPKSSVGRVFALARTVADHTEMYDALTPAGWKGEFYVLIRADAFPIRVSPGIAVSQVRLFDGPSFLDRLQSELATKKHGLLFASDQTRLGNPQRHADSFFLTLCVEKHIGWECRGSNEVLDMSQSGYDSAEFGFEPIEIRNGGLKLRKGCFYILATKERVMVPPELSAELRAIDPRFGEFRSHAAGYIDPGWGWGKGGEVFGRPITLELTLFENRQVHDGEHIARIRYEHMKEVPEVTYDSAASNYTVQETAALAKFFKK